MLTRIYSPTKKETGFTLIELLVVIIIIGILAAIAIPLFLDQRKLAVDSTVKSDVRNTATQAQQWRLDNPLTTAANTTEYIAAGGKVVNTGTNNVLGITAKADGSYTVCGYNAGGKAAATPETSWAYDSTTGKFGTTTSANCAGAVDGSGNDASFTPGPAKLTTPTTSSLPAAALGTPYNFQFTFTGGPTPILKATTIPAGLSLSTDGKLTGTPTTGGLGQQLVVEAKNTAGTDTQTYTIDVRQPATYTSSTGSFNATTGTAISGQSAAANSGEATITYTLAKDSYPAGASDTTFAVAANGALSGTPTVVGTYTFHVTASNGYGTPAVKNYTVVVSAPAGPTTSNLTYESAGFQGQTINGLTVNYITNSGYPDYMITPVQSGTKVHGGSYSLFLGTNGNQYTTGKVVVQVTNAVPGHKYGLSGYYTVAGNSNNTGNYDINGASGATSSGMTTICAPSSMTSATRTTWGSFTTANCTANSSTITWTFKLSGTLGPYSQNGWYMDDLTLTDTP